MHRDRIKKVVNLKEHYNTERLRPHFSSFEMKPLFIMTSESHVTATYKNKCALITATRSDTLPGSMENDLRSRSCDKSLHGMRSKRKSFLEGDASRFGGRDETKIPYEENMLFKIVSLLMRSSSRASVIGHGVSEIERQRSGADGGAIVKLNVSSLEGRAQLAGLLQICDGIDE